jgi:hypothetical protein
MAAVIASLGGGGGGGASADANMWNFHRRREEGNASPRGSNGGNLSPRNSNINGGNLSPRSSKIRFGRTAASEGGSSIGSPRTRRRRRRGPLRIIGGWRC